jgi:superfamily II DNA or RNA helicase
MQKLKPGDVVHVRHARWRVTEVRPYESCQVITLTAAGCMDHGGERRVVAPFDTIEAVSRVHRPRAVRMRRWRHACRELIAAHAPPAGLRFAAHARMDLLPHQLEPALAVLRGLGSRVLLADDVGLGKTMQAGLIAAELRARGWADRILILTPAGVREQWAEEIGRRLSMTAAIVDAAEVRRRVAMLPVGVNPWTTVPLAIASVDFVKRPEVLPAVRACLWDIIIVDEAHGVAGEGERYRAVSALAGRAAYVLLLTATPHSGDRHAFASLCAVGARDGDRLLVFRRSRRDVRLGVTRRVRRLLIRLSAAEAHMHALLARFARALRNERGDASALALSVLHKRALSSARSLERTVDRRLEALAIGPSHAAACTQQLILPLDEGDGELSPADEPPPWSADLSLADPAREQRLLTALRDAARTASADETKIRALKRLLRRIGEPALIFTEYRDTLLHLRHRLGGAVSLLHGGMTRQERAAALAEFSSGRRSILLATDAAGEGLNLHHTCRLVVNLELPWNPMRLEQRIGRVDRIGQQRTVHAVHLIARHTNEPRILERLKARISDARTEIDTPDPVGGAEVGEAGERPPDCAFPRLEHEASGEAARLTTARALAGGPAVASDIGGPWIARARRTVRERVGDRSLALIRATCEDFSGRVVESTLVPVLAGARLHRSRDSESPSQYEPPRYHELLHHPDVEAAIAAWRGEAGRVVEMFVSTRLDRERAIAQVGPDVDETVQRGLFDRRVEIAEAAQATMWLDAQLERRNRITRVEQAAALSWHARVLLILVP